MKAGANDLLTKPVPLSDLRQRIGEFSQRQRETSRLHYFEARERRRVQSLVGDSAVMKTLRERIVRIADIGGDDQHPPVLITGETGVGKELVARACHFESARAEQPFVELNCAAIPANLLESELFGHERGAFTDAKERKIGLLEAADGGTLFLDEIGEMDLALQAKLLKVIEDGRFRRVGSVQERQVNLRIVAATNQDLETRISNGLFRADLFFRLCVLRLNVPPLRERTGDAVLLANHFLAGFAQRYRRPAAKFSAEAECAINAHAWPGNVRELRNVVEQAILLAGADIIGPQDLLLPGKLDAAILTSASPLDILAGDEGGSTLDRVEREMLIKALAGAGGNISKAARELGISRDTLRYRIEKHGIRE
jgi:DNA-binding NtrC family response regulator